MQVYLCTALLLSLIPFATAALRTVPPEGASVVRQTHTRAGEFSTVIDAVNALPNDTSSQKIFVYPGIYTGQVNITRLGSVTILGWTLDIHDFRKNTVELTHNASLATAGSDDLSGTLRIKSSNFSMYNIDVRNTYGKALTNGQAIAISHYGSRSGIYACRFFSYQDTLYSNLGTQVYLKSYIEGAVDYIFGRGGQAYFEGNTIASVAPGCITAHGRQDNVSNSIYIFNRNKIISQKHAPFANDTTGQLFLGRPWGDYAKVIFKNTLVDTKLNSSVWSIWNPGDERTDHILFAEYNTRGFGVANAARPSFATMLTDEEAKAYSISTAVGSDYAEWVDPEYLVSR